MDSDFYPAPKVNWYPGAHSVQRTNPNGLSFPEPDFTAGGSACFGVGSFGAPEPNGMSFTGLGGGAMAEYARSEYGRPVGTGPDMMSFYTIAASQGFPRGQQPGNAKAPAEHGYLVVNVDSALDLTPSDAFGVHHYWATAGYPGETQEEMDERRTPPVKANPSPTRPQKENCVFHQRIVVPYNPRQQFVMVSIFEEDQLGDSFVGKATIPLAEERLPSTAPWPLIRDANPNGTLTLNIQVPNGDPIGTPPRGGGSWGGQVANMAPQSAPSFANPGLGLPPPTAALHDNGSTNSWAPMPSGSVGPQARAASPGPPQDPAQPHQREGQPLMGEQPQPQMHPHLQPPHHPAPASLPSASAVASPMSHSMRPGLTAGPMPGGIGNLSCLGGPVSHDLGSLPAGNGFGADPLLASKACLPMGVAGHPGLSGCPAPQVPDGFASLGGLSPCAQATRPYSYIPPPSPSIGGGAMPSHGARSWTPAPAVAATAPSVLSGVAVPRQPPSIGMGGGAGSMAGHTYLGAPTTQPSATPRLTSARPTQCAAVNPSEHHAYRGGCHPCQNRTASISGPSASAVAWTSSVSSAAHVTAMPATGRLMQGPAARPVAGPFGAAPSTPAPYYPAAVPAPVARDARLSASVAHGSPLPAFYKAGASGAAYSHIAGY